MDDSLDEDIARRVREIRGWLSKGSRPRRTIYLAAALYEAIKDHDPARFPDAIGVLGQFVGGYTRTAAAKAIFDGEDITDDPSYRRKRLAFGGGWEYRDVPSCDGAADSD